MVETGHDNVLGFTRSHGSESYTILVNFGEDSAALKLKDPLGERIISSDPSSASSSANLQLSPHEGVVYKSK